MKPILSSFIFSAILLSLTVAVCEAGILLPLSRRDLSDRGLANRTSVSEIRRDLESSAAGAISLNNIGSLAWEATISVGNPANQFTVLVDTGSGDIVLPAVSCVSNCKDHVLYSPPPPGNLNIPYRTGFTGGGIISGNVYADTAVIGPFTATSQAIAAATSYPVQMSKVNFPPDGLLGLGLTSLSKTTRAPFLLSLLNQGHLDKPVFALTLGVTPARLYIGGDDPDRPQLPITTFPLLANNLGYWAIELQAVVLNGVTVDSKTTARFDSGFNSIVGPSAQVKALYQGISGSRPAASVGPGYYLIPCKSNVKLEIVFGAVGFSLPPANFELVPDPGNPGFCLGAVSANSDRNANYWLIGTPFLQTVYARFEILGGGTGGTIGLAPQSNVDKEKCQSRYSVLNVNEYVAGTAVPNTNC